MWDGPVSENMVCHRKTGIYVGNGPDVTHSRETIALMFSRDECVGFCDVVPAFVVSFIVSYHYCLPFYILHIRSETALLLSCE